MKDDQETFGDFCGQHTMEKQYASEQSAREDSGGDWHIIAQGTREIKSQRWSSTNW